MTKQQNPRLHQRCLVSRHCRRSQTLFSASRVPYYYMQTLYSHWLGAWWWGGWGALLEDSVLWAWPNLNIQASPALALFLFAPYSSSEHIDLFESQKVYTPRDTHLALPPKQWDETPKQEASLWFCSFAVLVQCYLHSDRAACFWDHVSSMLISNMCSLKRKQLTQRTAIICCLVVFSHCSLLF